MESLRPYAGPKRNALLLVLLTLTLLLTQFYLLQHELEHNQSGQATTELCGFCEMAQNHQHSGLPAALPTVPSVFCYILLSLLSLCTLTSKLNYLISLPRAPPLNNIIA